MRDLLVSIRFVREIIGGMWYHLRPKYEYGIYGTYWTRRKPLPNEIIIKIEDHS
jgi:hypothetical protein